MIRTAQYSHAEYEIISVFFEKTNLQDYIIVFDKVKTIYFIKYMFKENLFLYNSVTMKKSFQADRNLDLIDFLCF